MSSIRAIHNEKTMTTLTPNPQQGECKASKQLPIHAYAMSLKTYKGYGILIITLLVRILHESVKVPFEFSILQK